MDTNAPVSNRVWIELLHAEVCWALAGRHIEAIVIKGPSIASWLYEPGERESADVDLLLRPSQWDAAVSVLEGLGFEATYSGFRETETALHSHDMQRTSAEQGLHGVDLHHFFPGIEVDPEEAFDVLWAGRVESAQGGVPVWFPSLEARALIIGLHAARQPGVSKTAEDLRRAMAALSADQLRGVGDLARRLDAQGALRAGVETLPETAGYVEALGLSGVEVPTHWVLLSQGADLLSIELDRVRSLPPRERVLAMGRWLVPSAASMRARHPEIGDSRVALAGVYVRRWGSGVRRLPGTVARIRAARRS
jgi:hypothetical protein